MVLTVALTTRQQFITSRNRPGTRITPTSVTVHNTATPNATAQNERDFLQTHPDAKVSFHFAVDDAEAVQCLPLDEMSWHAGSRANRQSMSIEVCEFDDRERQTMANRNAAELVSQLLAQFGWGLEQVKTHKDWTGKECPRKLLPMWDEFLLMIARGGEEMRFKDVPATHWAAGAIEQAVSQGWVGGFTDGTFRPEEPVTRAQAVSMVGRATVYMANRLQALIAKCKPAVVKVTSRSAAGTVLGAGSIITTDGYILTNEHVVKDRQAGQFYPDLQVHIVTDPELYEVTKAYPATVVATSNWDDLALLKVDLKGLPILPLASKTPPEGTAVVAVGHPSGMQYTSSAGVVTQDMAVIGGMITVMQTDAAINPGNSGGPIVDLGGRMVAVAVSKLQDLDNVAFGVRIEDVRNFVAKHLPNLVK